VTDFGRFDRNRMLVLNEPNAPRLSPALAQEIGLVESVLFLQIEFWCAIANHADDDGTRWTYQSLSRLNEAFPFWSKSTINRGLSKLKKRGLILVTCRNRRGYDRTRWFAINREAVAKLHSVKLVDIAAG
jgi:hypothetical protein